PERSVIGQFLPDQAEVRPSIGDLHLSHSRRREDEPAARRALGAVKARLAAERQRDRPRELGPSDERAEVHRVERAPAQDVGRRAVERTPEQLEYQAPTL